ncbi:MAG: hypothetical protein K2N12_05175 [Helicobacter sp.]|nr:hypothetical protein [Helicobacter sp.]
MLINAHSTNQSFTFGQTLANKEDSQDLIFTLPFAQSASSDSIFAETLTFGIQPPQPQNTIELRENLGLLDRIQKAEQAPKILGFPVDDEGYLTATFNKAAGIPESFRIHSETIVGMMKDKDTKLHQVQLSTSEDLVKHFQATYTRLQEIMGDNLHTETGFFTQKQLDSMPQAFVTRDGSFGGEIKKVYSQEEIADTEPVLEFGYGDHQRYLNKFSYDNILRLEPKVHFIVPFEGMSDFEWFSEKYLDENGNLSQGGLLAFAMWAGGSSHNQQPDFYTQSYYDIKEGKMSIEEYIKQYAESEFVEEAYRSGHQESAKRQIAFASWLKDKGFSEKDLNEMKEEDFKNLEKNFCDLLYAYERMKEEEKYSESQLIFFDPEAFLLQLFASHEALLDPNLLDVPDSLFEEVERKRALEDERYQPKQKDKETLTQKVKNAGAALAKVEQFLKTA